MVQLAQHRTALILYAVLLVLPAAVFGGLLWHQLSTDHGGQLAAAPDSVRGAGNRLAESVGEQLRGLLRQESARDYDQFQVDHYRRGTSLSGSFLLSPLVDLPRPAGILTWFAFETAHGADALPDHYWGSNPLREDDPARRAQLVDLVMHEVVAPLRGMTMDRINEDMVLNMVQDFRAQASGDEPFVDPEGRIEERRYSLETIAYNFHKRRDQECMTRDIEELVGLLDEQDVPTYVTPYQYRLVLDPYGRRLIIGTRRFMMLELVTDVSAGSVPDCFDALVAHDTDIVHGVVIDGEWLFAELPRQLARRVLSGRLELFIGDERKRAQEDGWESSSVDLLTGFEIGVKDRRIREASRVTVATNIGALSRAFRVQTYWFVGVAAVMIISLALGLRLLIGSVRASQEQAKRTENFVASVTHELRTPIAAVKMFSEMLRDGWVKADRQDEYLSRIVSESNRLDGLVDRVLEKRRLLGAPPDPEPGDLSREVAKQREELDLQDAADVAFDLAPNLPTVNLIPLGIHALVSNLVENARKYAPVNPHDPAAEPILVRTALAGRRVVLEVLDRGPGIPEEERERVFDEFYRIGDEATRRAPGTGLGLHLVAQYARTMGGSAQVLPRAGGGSCFQVSFKTLKGSSRS